VVVARTVSTQDFAIEDTSAAETRFIVEWNTGNCADRDGFSDQLMARGVSATECVTTGDFNGKREFQTGRAC
jgi:hypothetical protein